MSDCDVAPWAVTGVGSMPGTDLVESTRLVLGELPDLPHLVELPSRGVGADMIGRTLAMIDELGFDLQPSGWRLTGSSGADHRRARSLLAQDLDVLEEQADGYAGPLKLQLAGPWTLAASVERPRGDRLLADIGARRELAEALIEAAPRHAADVARRVPGARVVAQVDEPALPAILAGSVPTASGFHRHRSVDPPAASAALEPLFGALAGHAPVAHCCASDPPIRLLRGAGADAVSVDLLALSPEAVDALGGLLDGGGTAYLGVVATGSEPPEGGALADRVRRWLDLLGLDPDREGDRVRLTPSCGLAGADPALARRILGALVAAARDLRG